MARIAGLFATLSGGTAMLRPELAQYASIILLGSTMVAMASISRRRAYQQVNTVSN